MSARPLAAMIMLVSAWWLTIRDAAAAGGDPEALEPSQWTMWLVAGPMILAALYVWRSVFVEIGSTEAARTSSAAARPATAPPASTGTHPVTTPRDTNGSKAPATEQPRADADADADAEAATGAAAGREAAEDPAASSPPSTPAGPASPMDDETTTVTPAPTVADADARTDDDAARDAAPAGDTTDATTTTTTTTPTSETQAPPAPRPHTNRIGDTAVDEAVALHAAVKLLVSSSHGAVVFSTDASDEANALLDRIAEAMKATRYVAGTGPNVATAERLAAEGESGRRALHEMELALAIAGRGIDVVLFADERGEFGELTLRSLATMDSICLADGESPTSQASRVLLRIDGEAARLRVLNGLLDALRAARGHVAAERTEAAGSTSADDSDPAPTA